MDYLTKSEKRNLVVMYYKHKQINLENDYLKEVALIDSLEIVGLRSNLNQYQGMVTQLNEANKIKDRAFSETDKQVGLLRKQLKMQKLKTGLLIGGTGAAVLTILIGSIIIFR